MKSVLPNSKLDSARDETIMKTAGKELNDLWEEMVSQNHDRLVRFLYRRTGCKETAEDLAQESYTSAFVKREQLRSQGEFDRWIFTIARFQYLMWYRSRKKAKEISIHDQTDGKRMTLQLQDDRAKRLRISS